MKAFKKVRFSLMALVLAVCLGILSGGAVMADATPPAQPDYTTALLNTQTAAFGALATNADKLFGLLVAFMIFAWLWKRVRSAPKAG